MQIHILDNCGRACNQKGRNRGHGGSQGSDNRYAAQYRHHIFYNHDRNQSIRRAFNSRKNSSGQGSYQMNADHHDTYNYRTVDHCSVYGFCIFISKTADLRLRKADSSNSAKHPLGQIELERNISACSWVQQIHSLAGSRRLCGGCRNICHYVFKPAALCDNADGQKNGAYHHDNGACRIGKRNRVKASDRRIKNYDNREDNQTGHIAYPCTLGKQLSASDKLA